MRKSCVLCTEQMNRIARAFPKHPVWVDINSMEGVEDCPLFNMKELEEAILTIKIRRQVLMVSRLKFINWRQGQGEPRWMLL